MKKYRLLLLLVLLCGIIGCRLSGERLRRWFSLDGFRGDYYIDLIGDYRIDRVNGSRIVLEKKDVGSGSTTVIKNCFVTKYCLVDPYICVEGISTADAFITDEEKENCVVAYYVVDTESDSIEGPFAIFQEMAERFDYIHIPPIEAWQEPKHPDQR